MMNVEIQEVVRFLQSKHISITQQNEWLQGCCSWYSSNNPQINIQELQNFVYDQWLLADLRDIAENSLPTNISNISKTWLREKFTLQVDSVLDVGESCYSQLQKVKNVSTINMELTENKPQSWEPKNRRMLKLTCTDGVQTIFGMEYQLIPALREPFIPGFKVLVVGPVECRKGVMLLGPHNIQILGGEADSLIVKNAMENVLARALNLEENDNPFRYSYLQHEAINTNVNNDEIEDSALRVDSVTTNNDEFLDEDDDIFLSEQLTQVENLYRCAQVQHNVSENHSTNSIASINNDFTERNQMNIFSSNTNRPINIGNSFNNTNNNNRKVGIACPIIPPFNSSSKRPASSPTNDDLKIARTSTHDSGYQSNYGYGDSRTFNNSITDSLSTEFPPSTSSENFKVQHLKKFANSNCLRRCNASFRRITSKPRIREEMWHLSGEIGDETGAIEVAFSDSFLEEMFEFSAVEIASQKDRMKSNPDVKERVDNILKRGIQKITSLQGQFHIQFSTTADLPKIVNVI